MQNDLSLYNLELEHNSSEWLEFRKNGIGSSDAASILGKSPFKTNVELWEEKVGLREPKDISNKPYVKYGTEAEAPLIQIFALDYPQYEVIVNKRVVYKRGFMFCSLDGELIDRRTKEKGIYEGKTVEIHNRQAMFKWENQVPENYYIQILHDLIITNWAFAWLKAQIKQYGKCGEIEHITRHYPFRRADLLQDLKFLYLKEKEFWEEYVLPKKCPPLILPQLQKDI